MASPFFLADLHLIPANEGGISTSLPSDFCTVILVADNLELTADLHYRGSPEPGSKFRVSVQPVPGNLIKRIDMDCRFAIYQEKKLIGYGLALSNKIPRFRLVKPRA